MPIMSKALGPREFTPFAKSAKAGLLSFLGGLNPFASKKRKKRAGVRYARRPVRPTAEDPRREGQWRRVGNRWVRQRFGHEARQKRYNENYQKAFKKSAKEQLLEQDLRNRVDKRMQKITPPDLSHGGRIAKKKKRRRPSSQGNRLRSLLGGVSSYA